MLWFTGYPAKDDMIIITGVGRDSLGVDSHELEVQQAITRVHRDELGLGVLTGPRSIPIESRAVVGNFDAKNSRTLMKLRSPRQNNSLARRPEEFGMLKVTRTSLCHWLQKKCRN